MVEGVVAKDGEDIPWHLAKPLGKRKEYTEAIDRMNRLVSRSYFFRNPSGKVHYRVVTIRDTHLEVLVRCQGKPKSGTVCKNIKIVRVFVPEGGRCDKIEDPKFRGWVLLCPSCLREGCRKGK